MATSMEKSMLGKGSDFFDEDTPLCEPCSVTGDHLSAYRFCSDCQEHLCKKCSKYHVAQKAMRNHNLLTLEDKKKASTKVATDKSSHNCDEHKDKTIEYFCEDHSCLCCSACITIKHKQCSKPVYIPKVAADVIKQPDYKQFDKNLKSLETACKAEIDDVEKLLKQIEADELQIKTVFNDFRKRLNNALDQLEKEVTTKAKKITQEEAGKMKSLSKELDKSLIKVNTLTTKVDTLLNSGQRCDLYITIKQEENQLVHLSGELDAITRDKSCQRFEFRPNNNVLKPGALGSLDCRKENISSGRTFPIVPTSVPAPHRLVGQAKPAAKPPKTSHAVKSEPESYDRPSPAPLATRPQDIDYWRDMARRMKVGVRVRRGRDWGKPNKFGVVRGGNEDGGGLGTVTREGGPRGWWVVRWECGGEEVVYRMGGDQGDHYPLEIVEER